MSKYSTIFCSICGTDLYKPFETDNENDIQHVDYYELNCIYGVEHICPRCYNAGLSNQFIFWKDLDKIIFKED